jgi:XTP/dITP diphosphohydrolase
VLLTLVAISQRVAPGLLSRPAWRALDVADRVLSSDPGTVAALRGAGVAAEEVEDIEEVLSAAEAAEDGCRVAVLVEGPTAELLHGRWPGSELVPGSHDVPGSRLLDLVAVMDRLRAECPWDREQTHRSLARYLLEETYETLEAIESGDAAHLREELGDLLLQVVFHARIAGERGADGFDVDDVAAGITDKLVYRHPHVFAGLEVADAAEVDRNWEALKAAEKQRSSPLDGVPAALPALAYADKVMGRLARAGMLPTVTTDPDTDPVSTGERLLQLVASARDAGLDPEQELREAVRRLVARASLGVGPGADD